MKPFCWINVEYSKLEEALRWCIEIIGKPMQHSIMKWEYRDGNPTASFMIYDEEYEMIFRLKFQK